MTHPTIIPQRKIEGISAILLPYDAEGQIDFDGFAAHIERTYAAGLTPAVNMDTGYVNLLTPTERQEILRQTQIIADKRPFIAGTFIEGESGTPTALYATAIEAIQKANGTPILFQCSAIQAMTSSEIITLYRQIAAHADRLIAFELGKMFAPFGHIYNIETFQGIMEIPQIIGIKHSSLQRELEWERLALRDAIRPDFTIYTGNDLAIDMVMYGSDYLLGLSTFAPDYFAQRDAYWRDGDPRFYMLNDVLQYLGQFTFRPPVAAYKHSAAQFLKLRGYIQCDTPSPTSLRRPESDKPVLKQILAQLEALT
jgi:dihydrodipicolinate synthase/N-acetylneuraminate lyase